MSSECACAGHSDTAQAASVLKSAWDREGSRPDGAQSVADS